MIAVGVVTAKLATAAAQGMSGWNKDPNTQYHIQTDEGDDRYFRYQTISGQYRKEKRLHDGTVVGTYGWVDPNGFLRLRDYVADNNGYKVVRTKMVFVGKESSSRNNAGSTSVSQLPVSLTSPMTPPSSTGTLPSPSTPKSPTSITSDDYDYQLSLTSNGISQPSSTPFPTFPKQLPISVQSPASPNANTFLYTSNNPYFSIASDRHFDNSINNGYSNYDNQLVSASISNYPSYNLPPQQQQYPLYDGIAATHNGFRYYLPRQYHEEENSGSDTRAGSFGYIDPFGIRRVIYYNTAPGTGFVHKKNNRYVGFTATPYDPRT
ncbi:hypothetical protein PR048_013265 [Dryococelus australis]|uniref:Uncharacterized protein n=1 Tax=Dryococelus australis TaxID=614101 RepID=A0ABQ9HSF3_9NEOP|nr:hypothetical protein PR048_013265 [Dryococelus australis]